MECFAVSLRDSTPDAERGPTVGGTHTDAGGHMCEHTHTYTHAIGGDVEEWGANLCPTGAPFLLKLHPL